MIDVATPVLNALRYLSKQADMSLGGDDVNFWEWIDADDLPPLPKLHRASSNRSIARSIAETAITRCHIESACSYDTEFRAPIFDTFMLDAVSAHERNDYRKSILYSAMAVEIATATLLDEEYNSRVKPADAAAWRVIVIGVHGGQLVRKDPIWELLKQREDSSSLLHEGALYLLRRSLVIEDPPLFQAVKRLRATRNKIVHHGEPPDADQYLSIDYEGSADALNCASKVFKWLGIKQDYKLHAHGFVGLSSTPSAGE